METVGISEIIKEVEKKCDNWEIMFAALKEYRKNHGDCNVPAIWPENKQLGNWVIRQRVSYKNETLSEDRIKRLKDEGFIWDQLESQWEEMFAALKEYKDKHRHCSVPSKWPENKQLATWVNVQRRTYKEGNLSKDHIKRLEDEGFIWDQLESQWEEMFAALKEYKDKHRHCNVPRNWLENKQLATWVNVQRANYRKGNLSEEHIKRLEDIGFVWEPIKLAWEKKFEALKEYRKNHGDCNVPQGWAENEQLGTWVSNQRARKAKLSKDHIKRLEDEGFIWNIHK